MDIVKMSQTESVDNTGAGAAFTKASLKGAHEANRLPLAVVSWQLTATGCWRRC